MPSCLLKLLLSSALVVHGGTSISERMEGTPTQPPRLILLMIPLNEGPPVGE